MARTSPLLPLHDAAGAVLAPYGPDNAPDAIPLVQVYSGIDREYAAIRKSAAVFDCPHRAVLTVTGDDRLAFLNRMITQELKGLPGDGTPPFGLRRSFWLNRKGRIDADLVVIAQPDAILLELDAHAAARAVETLSAFVIADDVQIADQGDRSHRLDLHGAHAGTLLARVALPAAGSPSISELPIDAAGFYQIARETVLIWRNDATGDPGFSLLIPAARAADIYGLLAEQLDERTRDRARPDRAFDLKQPAADFRAVRAGWHAFNIARIEAGTAVYYLDYGPTSLPHETGTETLNSRVSFNKGCYLGQEVVARMNALGHPKQRLVGLDLSGAGNAQPVTGSLLFAADDTSQPSVGAVTSSAASPMLGGRSVCFAMVRYANANPGSQLFLQSNEQSALVPANVRESLRFWTRPTPAAASN